MASDQLLQDRGIINALKRAQEGGGVEKIYAPIGSSHLALAPDDYPRSDFGAIVPSPAAGNCHFSPGNRA